MVLPYVALSKWINDCFLTLFFNNVQLNHDEN
jgi:Na+/H+ antiporter NhaA